MTYETISLTVDGRGIAFLNLNRPAVHNAMNSLMWDEGRDAVATVSGDRDIRAVVLSGAGKTFCSGGDLKYQLAQRGSDRNVKVSEAEKLAHWLRDLDTLPKPLIGRVQGPAYAGGLGLISVCDIAIGLQTAEFSITEARLGLIPAMISPYVMRRIGASKCRRYFLTGRRFDAHEAVSLGLLDRIVPPQELDAAVEEELALVLRCAPGALAITKRLIDYVAESEFSDRLRYTVERIADMWADPEAIEGLSSFVEKRKPAWVAQFEHGEEANG